MILPQEPPPAAPRCGVAELAESRLRSNSYLALKNVSCAYADGVLTLDGYLPTYYLKQLAQEVVAGVDGVARVVNRIEVCRPVPSVTAGPEFCRA